MSTAVAERIDSLVTPEPPPCEVLWHKVQCGKPGAYTVTRSCECGHSSTRVFCERCYFELITGEVYCHFCLRPVDDWHLVT